MVNAEIVGDPHGPRQELTFFRISSASYRIYYTYEYVLEDVLGHILIFYQQKDGREDLFFVTIEDHLQGFRFSVDEQMD
jgi:hypothetical protein